ncbi:MAG TPA: hypothetical protein VGP47_04000 [Parachlamydiaceae bacterium]|nr:hypothetical protein [Parachlamydiaceae bacterium]
MCTPINEYTKSHMIMGVATGVVTALGYCKYNLDIIKLACMDIDHETVKCTKEVIAATIILSALVGGTIGLITSLAKKKLALEVQVRR